MVPVVSLALLALACKGDKDPGTPEVDTGTDAGVDTGTSSLVDADGDGFYSLPEGDDCDDANRSIHPGAEERCGDGVDQDCDGVEEGCLGLSLSDSFRTLDGATAWAAAGMSLSFLPSPRSVVVGAPGIDTDGEAGTAEGAYYVLSVDSLLVEGRSIDEAAEVAVYGEASDTVLGLASAVGDIDDDGVLDLVVTAPGNEDNDAPASQGVLVFSGVDAGLWAKGTAPSVQLRLGWDDANPDFGFRAGWDVDVVSVVHEDGAAALSLGVTGGCRLAGEGGVLIVPADTIEDRELSRDDIFYEGEQPCWDNFGVHAVGDLDGDGITDLVTAARSGGSKVETIGGKYRSDTMGPGYVYVVHGPLDEGGYLADADGRIEGAHEQALMGRAVNVSEDLDGDGYREVLAGATWEDHEHTNAGSAYVIPGPAAAHHGPAGDVATVHVVGDADELWLGYDVVDGGDQDGDGHRELMVTSMRADSIGEVSVFRGPLAGTLTRDDAVLWMVGTSPSYGLGCYPAFGGGLYTGFDLNDDGYDDWIAGARRNDAERIGSLHVMFGGVWE